MSKYLACGNVLFDSIKTIEGKFLGEHIGGQALYATSGIRLWNKDVKMVCNCGKYDFDSEYLPWIKNNGLVTSGINYEQDYTAHVCMQNTESGKYIITSNEKGLVYSNYLQGMMEVRTEQIEKAIDEDTKGIYQNLRIPDSVYFEKINHMRNKYDVKIMFELAYIKDSLPEIYVSIPKIKDAAKISGMWSLNRNEAADIFHIPSDNDEAIIQELMKFEGVEMCYYRCGNKGAYVVTRDNAYFVPMIDIDKSVDPVGCGNCSTGAVLAAWIETKGNPLMSGIMAAISAGYNAAQVGPWPLYSKQDEEHAKELANRYYEELRVNYKDLGDFQL